MEDGEVEVRGKSATVSLDDDGLIDLWICNNKNLTKGLGQKAVNNRVQAIPECSKWHILDGEAWGKLHDKGGIQRNLVLLGIRRKREVSAEQAKILERRFQND
jgi:hypothetical protein